MGLLQQPLLQNPPRTFLAQIAPVDDELTPFDRNAALAGGAPAKAQGAALVKDAATISQSTLLGGLVRLLGQLPGYPLSVAIDEIADLRVTDKVWRPHPDNAAIHLHYDSAASP